MQENFKTLAEYWREILDKEDKAIVFDERERGEIVTACLQSLFLLVPVVSTTFASLGRMFKDVIAQDAVGTLVIDEAGQASPECLVGALFRSRRAMIVGDPKQVEPVVTDELDLIKKSFKDEALIAYRDKTLSVQSFADRMNKYGTYLAGDDEPEWVGCPLLVHRRCISPMYDISNVVSYDGIMKQQARPPKPDKLFVYDTSRWIHVEGTENSGGKDHYVEAQFSAVKEIVETAFKNAGGEIPSLYIISPFTSVVNGVKDDLKKQCDIFKNAEYDKNQDYDANEDSDENEDFDTNENDKKAKNVEAFYSQIGTVHKFQGKEADEVIFLLGCDEKASGAVKWVNSNIVNVAATRAKYRLYIIGDKSANVWQKNKHLKTAMEILDEHNKNITVNN